MRFLVLGPMQMRARGRPLTPGRPKVKATLGVLLLHANTVVSTERLLEALWGPRPPRSAAGNLKTYVCALRKVLDQGDAGQRRLRTCSGGYLLRVGPGELDLQTFTHLAARGRQALAAGEVGAAANALGEALGLWRGRLLEDVPLEAAVTAELLRIEEQRLAVLDDLMEARLALGEHAALVGELRLLVADQPLQERRWGQLMVALYRCGRRAEALAAYRELRGRLVEDLGIEPGPLLQRLEQQVLTDDPALDLAPAPPATAPSGRCRRVPGVDRA